MNGSVEFSDETEIPVVLQETTPLMTRFVMKLPFVSSNAQANMLLIATALISLFFSALILTVVLYEPNATKYEGEYVSPSSV